MPCAPSDPACRIGLLADDLTGALDTAVNFAPMTFLADPADAPMTARFALSTGTRESADERAVIETVGAQARYLHPCDIAFLKIDSLWRGPIAPTLLAMFRSGAFDRCLLAPALPAQNRRTRLGRLVVADGEGTSPAGPYLAADLRRRGIPVDCLRPGDAPGPAWVQLADAETGEDLCRHVRAQAAGGGRTLFCGSAGLAGAIAGAAPPRIAPPGPVLLVVGSHHPVSAAQIAHLRAAGSFPVIAHHPGHPATAPLPAVDAALAARRSVALTFAFAEGTDRAKADRAIGAVLAALPGLRHPPACLMVVGGETFAQAVRGLGIARIAVAGEVRPGVPLSTVLGGAWDRTVLLSKSGAIGPPDLLQSLLAEATEGTAPAGPD